MNNETNLKTTTMTQSQINIEIRNTKEIMNNLMNCVKETNITIEDRNTYLSDYNKLAVYFLQLNQVKPNHNLTIA